MKIHINYAHARYLKSQEHCCNTALANGFDLTIPYRLGDISPEFIRANSYTVSQPRGAGFWIWKPYLIMKTMQERMGDDDWLMYTDSGMYFVRNPWDWILPMEDRIGEKGIVTFGCCGRARQFTKRDTFVLMGMDEPRYTDSAEQDQRMASVFVCKKTPFSMAFVEEWMRYCSDPRILTDLPNTQGLPNYPEFKDHRHDQAIMSLLCIKYDTFLVREDITQFTNSNPYIIHTRNPS
jgi:hypothetical protein